MRPDEFAAARIGVAPAHRLAASRLFVANLALDRSPRCLAGFPLPDWLPARQHLEALGYRRPFVRLASGRFPISRPVSCQWRRRPVNHRKSAREFYEVHFVGNYDDWKAKPLDVRRAMNVAVSANQLADW